MNLTGGRMWAVAGGVAFVFIITVIVGLQVLPQPLGRTDYLVIGAVGTFLALLVLFFVLISSKGKMRENFVKRTQEATKEEPDGRG